MPAYEACARIRRRDGYADRPIVLTVQEVSPRTMAAAGAILVLSFATANAQATLTHTTSNLNLRGGPGTHYPIRSVIPAGTRIDVHSCGHEWCYTTWVGGRGYVNRDYLIHHAVR